MRVCVMESFPAIRPTTNPYITQLWAALQDEPRLDPQFFSWRRALLGRYDVFHVHWPEQLMGGWTLKGRTARRLMTALFCLRMWVTRTPVVRTWHNLERPADLAWVDRRLLDALDHLTRMRIRLNPVSPMPDDADFVTILHGDYRDWFAPHPHQEARPGRLGYVGLIRRYKGVEELLEAFAQLDRPDASLHVAGSPSSEELAAAVLSATQVDPRVTARLEYLEDADLAHEVTASALVVLPYRFMHNSGAVLAALSLDRPVLVPDNEVNRELGEEIGREWVLRFAPPLTVDHLAQALDQVAQAPAAGTSPDLSRRSWTRAGAEHADAFIAARKGR